MSNAPAPADAPSREEVVEAAERSLSRLVGSEGARLRDGQGEAIDALVRRRERVLVVQRTGWGKSAVYFVATQLLRARGAGPTLIVSPLLSLMRDQVAAAARAGVRAVTMNSANAQEWTQIEAAVAADEVDVLLVSPERLNNPRFREAQLPALAARCGLLVVDEAHCISDWGHDFRPDYRRIRDILQDLPAGTPVLATTATANERVVTDVVEQLRAGVPDAPADHEVSVVRGSLARDSLRLAVLDLDSAQRRVAWLVEHLPDLPGSGIVYALTVSAAEDLAQTLRSSGQEVRSYTGRTAPEEREELEEALRENRVKALVATSALGMGFDKPDLGFVVHLGAPSSPVAYYQQVGRAGRATERADVVLLPGTEDRDIWAYFASASMPRQDHADAVLTALAEAGSALSTAALETRVDVRRTRLELLLKVLDVEGAVTRVSGGWASTGRPWTYDAERYERVAAEREAEQRLMLDYERGDTCRMRFLQECLDDPDARDCGRCDVCAGPFLPTDVTPVAERAARAQVDRVGVPIAPRAQWPTGMSGLGVPVKGRLGADLAAAEGRALARLSDLGWGQRVRALLADDAPDEPVPDAVLQAVVRVLAEWDWDERPVAVTWLPSRRRPTLVASLATRVAELGRLRPLGPLDLVGEGPRGGPGGNSAYRLADVWSAFAVGEWLGASLAQVPGPVLLVDDLVDSRWTMTVAAAHLRRAGAPAVLPLALALAG